MTRSRILASALAIGLMPGSPARGQCTLDWDPRFARAGADSTVHALISWDDGTGEKLYAGGSFARIHLVSMPGIAMFDGETWKRLGANPPSSVYAMAIFDDGNGEALYVGGAFTSAGGAPASRIAKWDGTTWSALSDGGLDGDVFALHAFDDGSGPALYAGGDFINAGGSSANRVAKWDGSTWSALGDGFNATVRSLSSYAPSGGGSPQLYAGGDFTMSGSNGVSRIAQWDGSAWTSPDGGMTSSVWAMTVYDDGSGPKLFAGGGFTTAGGVPASALAKWDGDAWSSVDGGANNLVRALTVFDHGDGSSLYVGGFFTEVGASIPALRVAKWNSFGWQPLSLDPLDTVGTGINALASFDDGTGPVLCAGGTFASANGKSVGRLAKWDGSDWTAIGPSNGLSGQANAMAAFDDGNGDGPSLYVGGLFAGAGGVPMNHIAKWNGSRWFSLEAGVNEGTDGDVFALTTYDDGSEEALFVGGQFASLGGSHDDSLVVNNIAKWDGTTWSALGEGVFGTPVRALIVFDDGSGPALYVGGDFTMAGGATANRVAKWDGRNWSAVGDGFNENFVSCFAVHNDGGGPALYAGGSFTMSDTTTVNRIAKWTGSAWVPLGSGMTGFEVKALTSFTLDGKDVLVAGGNFNGLNGNPPRLAAWDGATWSAIGDTPNGDVSALAVHDDGDGPKLYIGGSFSMIGGQLINRIAKWTGTAWVQVGQGFHTTAGGDGVRTLLGFDHEGGHSLYLGGSITTVSSATTVPSQNIARWFRCAEPPEVVEQPDDESAADGEPAILSCRATGGDLDYRWRREGVPLINDFRTTGAAARTLLISAVEPGDEGLYDVLITNADGSTTTRTASLTVITPCLGDIGPPGGDGVVDVNDLLLLIGAWGPCAPPCPADLNSDGSVDVNDLLLLIGAWGACS